MTTNAKNYNIPQNPSADGESAQANPNPNAGLPQQAQALG